MYKLLLSLGLIDLAFHHPLLTALTLVGVFLYQQSTKEERQQIKQVTMSIYTNTKSFSQYLISKATELGITMPELRKKVAIDLEIPEVEAPEVETNNSFNGNEEFELFARDFSPEERQVFIENEFAREKVRRLLLDIIRQPEAVWVEGTLADCLLQDDSLIDYKQDFSQWKISVNWDATFTPKDFRQLKKKLKSVGKNPDGSIQNEEEHSGALLTIQMIENYFTNYQFT